MVGQRAHLVARELVFDLLQRHSISCQRTHVVRRLCLVIEVASFTIGTVLATCYELTDLMCSEYAQHGQIIMRNRSDQSLQNNTMVCADASSCPFHFFKACGSGAFVRATPLDAQF